MPRNGHTSVWWEDVGGGRVAAPRNRNALPSSLRLVVGQYYLWVCKFMKFETGVAERDGLMRLPRCELFGYGGVTLK